MTTRRLGAAGPWVGTLGLGCMGMSDLYGPADEAESVATIHAALDAGMTLLDTGDFYGMGHNELLLRRALVGRPREDFVLSVKFGALRDHAGGWNGVDTRPVAIRNFLAYTLRRLGTDYVDIYRPARLDPVVPIEETVGALGALVREGLIRYIGLSEVGAETLRRAQAVHPIADLQIEYSLFSRSIESAVLPACRELGVGVTAYGVLCRGLLSGHWSRDRVPVPGDFRGYLPRWSGKNLETNLRLVEALRVVANERNATVAQVAIAWVAAQGNDIVPLVGARRCDRLAEALESEAIQLAPEDRARIEAAVPREAVAGERYPQGLMAHLDSERR